MTSPLTHKLNAAAPWNFMDDPYRMVDTLSSFLLDEEQCASRGRPGDLKFLSAWRHRKKMYWQSRGAKKLLNGYLFYFMAKRDSVFVHRLRSVILGISVDGSYELPYYDICRVLDIPMVESTDGFGWDPDKARVHKCLVVPGALQKLAAIYMEDARAELSYELSMWTGYDEDSPEKGQEPAVIYKERRDAADAVFSALDRAVDIKQEAGYNRIVEAGDDAPQHVRPLRNYEYDSSRFQIHEAPDVSDI